MTVIDKILRIIIIFAFSANLVSCKNEKEQETRYTGKPKIQFFNSVYDFGTLAEGETVEYAFKYKNTGTAPLKIKNIITDCGCTVPEYDKNTILPGKESKIKVTFNTSGFRNNIYKTITVETNADTSRIKLVLTAFIKNNNNLNY